MWQFVRLSNEKDDGFEFISYLLSEFWLKIIDGKDFLSLCWTLQFWMVKSLLTVATNEVTECTSISFKSFTNADLCCISWENIGKKCAVIIKQDNIFYRRYCFPQDANEVFFCSSADGCCRSHCFHLHRSRNATTAQCCSVDEMQKIQSHFKSKVNE